MATNGRWLRGLAVVVAVMAVGTGLAVATSPHKPEWSAPWVPRVEAVDQALASREISAAIYAWREAHGAALRSLRWDALADVGDAAVRMERATGDASFRAEARRVYLHALFRARAARAVDGIHRLAAAFAELGDTEVAARALEMAASVPARELTR